MTSLSYQIGSLLLPICLEETAKAREIYKPAIDIKSLAPEVQELNDILKEQHRSGASRDSVMSFRRFAMLCLPAHREAIKNLILPHDVKDILPLYEPFTVIVVTHKAGGNLHIDVPRIVTHGKSGSTLWFDDEISDVYFTDKTNNSRVATDEEVELCVMNLDPFQLRRVMSLDLFAPIVSRLFEEQTELIAEESGHTKDE